MVFEIHMCGIYSTPYRLSSTCSGRQIPSTVMNLPTKFCDDRAKGVGIMANHFSAPPIVTIHWSVVAMFLTSLAHSL